MRKRKKMVVIAIVAVFVLMMPTIAVASEDEPRWAKYEQKWMPEDPGTNHGTAPTTIAIVIVGIVISVLLLIILKHQLDIKKALLKKKP